MTNTAMAIAPNETTNTATSGEILGDNALSTVETLPAHNFRLGKKQVNKTGEILTPPHEALEKESLLKYRKDSLEVQKPSEGGLSLAEICMVMTAAAGITVPTMVFINEPSVFEALGGVAIGLVFFSAAALFAKLQWGDRIYVRKASKAMRKIANEFATLIDDNYGYSEKINLDEIIDAITDNSTVKVNSYFSVKFTSNETTGEVTLTPVYDNDNAKDLFSTMRKLRTIHSTTSKETTDFCYSEINSLLDKATYSNAPLSGRALKKVQTILENNMKNDERKPIENVLKFKLYAFEEESE